MRYFAKSERDSNVIIPCILLYYVSINFVICKITEWVVLLLIACFFGQNTTTHCVVSQMKLLSNEYILQSNALHDDVAHLNISICFANATERNERVIYWLRHFQYKLNYHAMSIFYNQRIICFAFKHFYMLCNWTQWVYDLLLIALITYQLMWCESGVTKAIITA